MGSEKILLQYESLLDFSQNLTSQGAIFDECVTGIKNLVGSLPDSWEGQSAQAYQEQFEALQPAFDATKQIIQILNDEVMAIMSQMKEKDSEIASKLGF